MYTDPSSSSSSMMSPDATQNPAQPLFIECSGVPAFDQDDRSQFPMDCESNNPSGPECIRLDNNDAVLCVKREINDDLDLDETSNYDSISAHDEHSPKEDIKNPLLDGIHDDSTEEQLSVEAKSVLVPVRDPVTKQIKHEMVPIEIMDETGLNIIKSVLIPVRDLNGAVCYEVKKVLVPIRPELTLPHKPNVTFPIIPDITMPQQNVTKWAKKQSKLHDVNDKSLNDQNKCQLCQKVYNTQKLLSKHIRRIHKLSYRCVYCHQTYDSKADYKKHARTHEENTYVECALCQQRYKRMSGLKRHQIRMHSNIEPKFICDHCDNRFKLKCDLVLHIDRVHSNDAHACKLCGKCFTSTNTLRVHELRHSGLRPYICDICGQSYTRRSCMMVHHKKHPGNRPPPPRVNLVNIEKW